MISLAISLLFCSLSVSRAQLIPAAFTFGDSTVDAGNNDYLKTIFRANFPPYGRDFDTKQPTGRFSNGRTPSDYLAALLGLPLALPYLDPSAKGQNIVTGVNFATGGSGYLSETGATLNVPGLDGQLQWFKSYTQNLVKIVGKANATNIISQGVYTLSTGSNDYVANYYVNPLVQEKYSRNAFRSLLLSSFTQFTKALYSLGARRIAVVSMAPLGCLPSMVTLYGKGSLSCVDFANRDARLFNRALNSTVTSIRASLKDIKLAYIDIYPLVEDVIKNPSKNGFEQTTTGCCGIGRLAVSILCNEHSIGTCSNASKYVFWDSFHPTSTMNQLIANTAFNQGIGQLL
ncbi:hypothetical protein SELMODRAFT_161618 [Selaginella moellendorffii]|uniref:Uncharacterized protein n=1 Tax=Selaginella moellendorffii TaxID=88036 RepID=D8T6Z9_SELML|nr:GDSL esterase/lipase APG [Selaginella moellendorffii]EFJ07536.1 hypothetical protein SELMODRAFT_161618 [Selaginella moellendorffii]|eukprot:XP_002991424.1 GDSL esterase/lipase APG [Selaginella moellendorffii]